MQFCDHLNIVMESLSATTTQLAEATGLNKGTISRYRRGLTLPNLENNTIEIIVGGLQKIAREQGAMNISSLALREVFERSIRQQRETLDPGPFSRRLRALLDEMDLGVKGLSRRLNYDSSLLYRIRSGTRSPGNAASFAEGVADYALATCTSLDDLQTICRLIGLDYGPDVESESLRKPLEEWLMHGRSSDVNLSYRMFVAIDSYNIEDHIHLPEQLQQAGFDASSVVKTKREYFGENAIEEATHDFLATLAAGNSFKTLTMYSEFPSERSEDHLSKSALFMQHLATLVGKGVHVTTIHSANRAFDSMVMDFEMWLPLFMSGNITSYYIGDDAGDASRFRHCCLVAGDAVLVGEELTRHRESARASVTRDKREVEYYRSRNEMLIKDARLLVECIGPQRQEELRQLFEKDSSMEGERLSFNCSPPLCTIPDELLKRILDRARVGSALSKQIHDWVDETRMTMSKRLEHGTMKTIVCTYSKPEFEADPPMLFLADFPVQCSIAYTPNEYQEHLQATKTYAEKHKAFQLTLYPDPGYRNIRIVIHRGKWSVVSSNKAQGRHGIITHPGLCRRMERTGAFRLLTE